MPLDPKILGFANRWYKEALREARIQILQPSLKVRVISAPVFLATKMEAFRGRGHRDYFSSHDLEDVLSVVDGRPELIEEVEASSQNLSTYLASEFRVLLQTARFIDALPAHLAPDPASQSRIPLLLKRIQKLAQQI
jgi:predicted nucleotidyltransferase